MITADQLDLIAAIHHGATQVPAWSDTLRLLRLAFGGNGATLVLREARAAPETIFSVEDYSGPKPEQLKAELRARYFGGFYRDDPFPYFEMTPSAVYRLPELLGCVSPERSPYYNAYLRPAGLEHLILFHAAEPGGGRAWVTLTRGPDAQDFNEADISLCKVLAQQFSTALGSFATLQSERMRAQLYAHAARQLNVDFLLLDQNGCLILADEQIAGPRFRSAGLHLGPDRRLFAADAQFDTAFQRAVCETRGGGGGQVLHVSDMPYLDVFICPTDPVQPSHPSFGRQNPAIVIYLHSGPVLISSVHIKALFGLSGTEARLAAALVQGRTLVQAARDIGVTEQTARRYSKLVFSKTGANRQSDLIRKILGSAAVLAGDNLQTRTIFPFGSMPDKYRSLTGEYGTRL